MEIIKCTVNPKQGQQIQGAEPLLEPKRQKKVLVIGGGPGGMEAAITAAGRGHKVTLVEKSDKLGEISTLQGRRILKKISESCAMF